MTVGDMVIDVRYKYIHREQLLFSKKAITEERNTAKRKALNYSSPATCAGLYTGCRHSLDIVKSGIKQQTLKKVRCPLTVMHPLTCKIHKS